MTGSQHPVPVLLDETDPRFCERHRAAVATLPSRYILAETAAGGVAAISGTGADWTERARQQLCDGAAAVLIGIGEHIDEVGLEAIEQAAGQCGAIVVADLEYAADPAWLAFAETAPIAEADLIDGVSVTTGSLRAAIIRLLITLAVAGIQPDFEPIVIAGDHWVLGSSGGGAPVTLAATCGADESGQRLDLVASQVRYEIFWPDQPRASPTTLYTHTKAGTERSELTYEAPERGLWQRLHASLTGPGTRGADSSLAYLRAALGSVSLPTPGPVAGHTDRRIVNGGLG